MPTPKITEYTAAVPPEKTSVVINIELVVPSEDIETAENELDHFLDCHIRTVGAAAVFNRQLVAHPIKRAMEIMINRYNARKIKR